jgi:hypothetical protein
MKTTNKNSTTLPAWMVFYVTGATQAQHGVIKKKEFCREGNALRFARKNNTEVLPIVN